MATIIKATKWIKEGKTVVRKDSKYPLHAQAFHIGGQSEYWIHSYGSPAAFNSDDILADDWEIWQA